MHKRVIIYIFVLISQFHIPYNIYAETSIKVGIYNNEPLIFADDQGRGRGLFADIIEYIAAKENFKIKYISGTFQQNLERLENNEIDILCVIAFSKQRDKLYDFNRENLLTNWGQLYTSLHSDIRSIADVEGKTIAVLNNDIYYEFFTQLIKNFGIKTKFIKTDDYHTVLKLVSDNKADAGITNRFFGMKFKNRYSVDRSGIIFNPIKIHFAVNKGKNRELVKIIDKHITLLKQDDNSVYYQSIDRWFGAVSAANAIPAWVKWAFLLIIALTALLLIGTMILKRQVKVKTMEIRDELRQRKIAEKKLELETRRFKILSTLTFEGIVLHLNGKIMDINDAFLKMVGYTREELIGKNIIKLCVAPDSQALVRQNMEKRSVDAYEATVVKKDGTHFPVEIEARDINYENQQFRVAAVRDMTEKVELQRQINHSQKMEAIGTLSGGIAHDFNNILFPIMGHTDILMAKLPKDSPFQSNLKKIYLATMRARELVRQILAFSRQEKGELKLMKIQPVIEEVLKLIRSSIPATIEITHDISLKCGMIKADSTQVHQIIMNLATNAYHSMEESGGKMSITLNEIDLGDNDIVNPDMLPGRYACLKVKDSGTGMDKELIQKIFDPFFTTKKQGKGTGMGLSVVHGIVSNMHGAIKVYSEKGRGTQFSVYLPIAKSAVKRENIKQVQPFKGGSEKILLVDDEKIVIEMEESMLRHLGYQVTSFTSSTKALQTFKTDYDKFDMVITDMSMPDLPGDKLAAELIKVSPEIPILLLSGFCEAFSQENAEHAGVKGFLLKPVTMQDFAQKIRQLLDKA